MREDGDFLSDLRKEIAATQDRRHKFVMAKLAFVTGLLGFGFAGSGQGMPTGLLLLLVPLVTFVFDLYIMGEDFAVKRIGKFLMLSDGTPPLEVAWEKGVGKARDRFSYYATPLSSALALLAAAIGSFRVVSLAVAIPCIVVGLGFVTVVFLNRRWQDRLLKSFRPAVKTARPRRKKKKPAKRPAEVNRAELNGEVAEPEQQPLLPL